MDVYIGVHGGAQTSSAVALDVTNTRLEKVDGELGLPLHHTEPPHDFIWRQFLKLMRRLATKLRLDEHELRAATRGVVVALPGAYGANFHELATSIFAGHNWPNIVVIDDTEAVLYSGPTQTGVALVCGTGTAVYARTLDGRDVKVDGWGPFLGDDGSAFDIGLRALRSIVRGHDGRGPKCQMLTDLVLSKLAADCGADLVDDLVTWLSDAQGGKNRHLLRQRIAEVAPIVDAAAKAHDAHAQHLLDDCASDLMLSVRTAVRSMDLPLDFDLYYEGGAIDGSETYRKLFLNHLRIEFPEATPSPPRYKTSVGALLAAHCIYNEVSPNALPADLLAVLPTNPGSLSVT